MICMKDSIEMIHVPVMEKEILEYLVPAHGACRIIDGTLGFGGHSSAIIRKNPLVEVLGIDRDLHALNYSRTLFAGLAEKITIVKARFSELADVAASIGWDYVDAILLDIGVSSHQIDEDFRGFSFRKNGPLDMRMDSEDKKTASYILNKSSVEELSEIFKNYGEINGAYKLAKAVVEKRSVKPWLSTKEFSELCEDVLPFQRRNGPPVSTLCFQALRIAVNDELNELDKGVTEAIRLLKKGGRIGVISYHSLEDRIVKNIFRRESTDCLCNVKLPICKCGHKASVRLITKKPLVPTAEEVRNNRRASSAKMRIAEKIVKQCLHQKLE